MYCESSNLEQRYEAPLFPGLRIATILSVCLVGLTGCNGSDFVQVDSEGDRTIFTDPVSWGLSTAMTIVLLGFGALLLIGWIRFKGKPRVVGVILTILGLCFAFHAVGVGPYASMAIDGRVLFIQSGLFGQSTKTVDLSTIKTIDIYHVGRSRRGKGSRRGKRTQVQFTSDRGESQSVNMGGNMGELALSHVLKMASDLGIAVKDHR